MAYFGLYGSIGAQKAKSADLAKSPDLAEIVVFDHFEGMAPNHPFWPPGGPIEPYRPKWPILAYIWPIWAILGLQVLKRAILAILAKMTLFGHFSGFG